MRFRILHILIIPVLLALTAPFCGGSLITPVKSLSLEDSKHRLHDAKIVICTNRIPSSAEGENRFFGTKIDPTGKISQISVDFADGEARIVNFDTLDDALDAINPSDDILVFVHGDGKGFTQTIEYCARLNSLYGISVIAFDWPSKDPTKPDGASNFYKSLQNAKHSAPAFAAFIHTVNDYYGKRRRAGSISILFHSLGAMVLQRCAELDSATIANPVFANLILDAPAVRQKRHAKWLCKVSMQKRLYVTMNDDDFTLHGASMLLFGKMLGIGATPPYTGNAEYIDFSEVLGTEHNYLIMDAESSGKEILTFYKEVLHGKCSDTKNITRFKINGDANSFKLLKQEPSQNHPDNKSVTR